MLSQGTAHPKSGRRTYRDLFILLICFVERESAGSLGRQTQTVVGGGGWGRKNFEIAEQSTENEISWGEKMKNRAICMEGVGSPKTVWSRFSPLRHSLFTVNQPRVFLPPPTPLPLDFVRAHVCKHRQWVRGRRRQRRRRRRRRRGECFSHFCNVSACVRVWF